MREFDPKYPEGIDADYNEREWEREEFWAGRTCAECDRPLDRRGVYCRACHARRLDAQEGRP